MATFPFAGSASAEPAENPDVSTFAGDGRLGIVDGDAARAEFVLPTGIARESDGSLIVADAGAQRIRKISPDGRVTTIAGAGVFDSARLAVAGGFRNGPAQTALFHFPSAVAVRKDGSILVADTMNACVRQIAGDVVSTFAGACGQPGDATGPLATARVGYPTAVADAPDGAVYIGDNNGIRVVSPSGMLSVLAVPAAAVHGLAVSGSTLIAADSKGLLIVDLSRPQDARRIDDGGEYGHPFGVFALDPSHFVYTDLASNSIRLLTVEHGVYFARIVTDKESASASGDADGTNALYDGPWSVTSDGTGGFLVCDSANRQLRRLSAFDVGTISPEDAFRKLSASHARTKILVIGNSLSSFNTDPEQSTAAFAERRLRAGGIDATVAVASIPSATNAVILDVLREYVTRGAVTDVVVIENRISLESSYMNVLTGDDYAKWSGSLRSDVAGMVAEARTQGYHLVFALQPTVYELPLGNSLAYMERVGANDVPVAWVHTQLLQAFAGTGTDVLDLWPAFYAYVSKARHEPLYASDDFHPSCAGREFVGVQIATYLTATGLLR